MGRVRRRIFPAAVSAIIVSAKAAVGIIAKAAEKVKPVKVRRAIVRSIVVVVFTGVIIGTAVGIIFAIRVFLCIGCKRKGRFLVNELKAGNILWNNENEVSGTG